MCRQLTPPLHPRTNPRDAQGSQDIPTSHPCHDRAKPAPPNPNLDYSPRHARATVLCPQRRCAQARTLAVAEAAAVPRRRGTAARGAQRAQHPFRRVVQASAGRTTAVCGPAARGAGRRVGWRWGKHRLSTFGPRPFLSCSRGVHILALPSVAAHTAHSVVVVHQAVTGGVISPTSAGDELS
eukprot:gene9568-biopygen4714